MTMELKFSRADRLYRPPDIVEGRMIVNAPAALSHQGIKIMLVGTVTLQPSLRTVGVLESLYTTIKPIQLLNKTLQVNSAGKIGPGLTEIPFRVSLDGSKGGVGNSLHDTYHGAHINIQYVLTAEISRGYMLKSLCASLELIIEGSGGKIPHSPSQGESVHFYITQDTQKHSILPSIRSGGFRVVGRVTTRCSLMEPVVGEITVEYSAVPIRSIDLNLLRMESIALNDRLASETTEVQATQVADGDVCRGLSLPIYMILPRLLTCPTLSAGSFSLEFRLSITITFEAEISKFYSQSDSITSKEWVAMETLPLRLTH